MKRINLFFLVLILGGAVNAQVDDSFLLEEVIINEDRMPHSISEADRTVRIIDGQRLQEQNVSNLQDMLAYVSGVDLRQRGSQGVQADVGIRGSNFEQVLILVNGMKMYDPQTGHHNLNLPIPIQNIERVEVIKGPMAHVYGPNAFAGVINIITKTAETSSVSLSGMGGSYGLREGQLSVNLGGKYRQLISLSSTSSDTFRYNTDFETFNILYQGETEGNGNRLEFMAGMNEKQFGANGFYASSDYPHQYEETRGLFGGITYERQLNDSNRLSFRFYARQHDDHYVFNRSNPSVFENFHTTYVYAAETGWNREGKKSHLYAGLDFRHEGIMSSNLDTHSRSILAVYGNYRYNLSESFRLNAGLNLSQISDYPLQAFPNLSLNYKLNHAWNLYGSAARSYRVPSYTDLFYVGRENIGNPELRAEKAYSYELGSRWIKEVFQLQGSLFYRDAANAIEWVRDNDSALWQPRNFHRVQTSGVELEMRFLAADFFENKGPFEDVRLSYTYLNSDLATLDEVESKYAFEYLRHQLIGQVQHKLFGELHHLISLRFLDRFHMDPYWLVDSRIYWKEENWLAFVEATNLFNQTYRETNLVRMPGRWIRFGARWTLDFSSF